MAGNRWTILSVLFLARTAMGFQFQAVASTAPFLIRDLHIGYATVGTLIGLYMLPGVAVAYPGGLLSRRLGDKAICAAGLTLMMVGGALMGQGHSASAMVAGRVLSGSGAVLFNLVLTKMTTDWFAGREIVLAMGVVLASWPFGIAAGLLLQPPVAAAAGWRWVMYATAAVAAVALLLVGRFYRAPPGASLPVHDPGGVPSVPPCRQSVPAMIAGAIWGNLNLALVLFFSFGPAAMMEHGVAQGIARGWTGAALWIVMFSVPLGGVVVQRSGRPGGAIVVFSGLGALALALLPVGIAAPALGAAFGVSIGPPAGAIMALPARVLAPEHRAGGLGLFMTWYYAIQSLGPAGAGMLRDAFGTAAAPIWLAAALMAGIVPLLAMFEIVAARAQARDAQ